MMEAHMWSCMSMASFPACLSSFMEIDEVDGCQYPHDINRLSHLPICKNQMPLNLGYGKLNAF